MSLTSHARDVFNYSGNPSIMDTFGEQCFGIYTEVAFVEGLFCTQTVHLGRGCLAVIYSSWPLFGGGC